MGQARVVTNEMLGSLIGTTFGLVFVEVNAGKLPTGIGTALRVLGVVAFLVYLGLLARARARPESHDGHSVEAGQAKIDFGRGYRLVVAAEVVVGAVGLAVINGRLDAPQAGVAWVALVVGLHFLGLAAVWRQPFLFWLGTAIAVCGAVGLILAAADASAAAIAAISGVVPGGLLLGAGWLFALGRPRPSSA